MKLSSPKFLYFLKKSFSYITGNGTSFKKTSYISVSNFPTSKNKKTHSEKMYYISGNGTFRLQKP